MVCKTNTQIYGSNLYHFKNKLVVTLTWHLDDLNSYRAIVPTLVPTAIRLDVEQWVTWLNLLMAGEISDRGRVFNCVGSTQCNMMSIT